MTALPAKTSLSGATSELQFKTALDDQRDFLAGLLGTGGGAAEARTALGVATLAETQAAQAAAEAAKTAAQGYAASAASVVDQDLSMIDATLLPTAITAMFVYDTNKDSDGGRWRERCGHTSWENETLAGTWLGSATNETAARLITGATTGSYYYDTTAAGFYSLNAGSGKTACYRGNARKFPAKVLITVEAARVVIWDLTQAGAPMWMVFKTTYSVSVVMLLGSSGVAALNGRIIVVGTVNGLVYVSFVADAGYNINAVGTYQFKGNVSARNSENGSLKVSTVALVNAACNAVAATTLPNAPVDVVTSLPIPTIAVGTDGGISLMKDDGTVKNSSITFKVTRVAFAGTTLFSTVGHSGGVNQRAYVYADAGNLGSSFANTRIYYGFREATANPVLCGTGVNSTPSGWMMTASGERRFVFGSPNYAGNDAVSRQCLVFLSENAVSPTLGMVSYAAIDHISGWLPGDIRAAWLADTVVETLVDTNLVSNWTFGTDTSGWSGFNGATLAAVGGALEITAPGSQDYPQARYSISCVVGKAYTVRASVKRGTFTGSVRTGVYEIANAYADMSSTSYATVEFTFVATATTHTIQIIENATAVTAGQTAYCDWITVGLASADRSVKAGGALTGTANAIRAVGSITKAAVASGAQLVGFSGFSAANYLEQAYSANLDFGTGDFCVMGWIKEAPNSTTEVIAYRAHYSGGWAGAGFHLYLNGDGTVTAHVSDDGFATFDGISSGVAIDDSQWRLLSLVRRGGYLEMWLGDTKAAFDVALSNAAGSLSNGSATLRFGASQNAGGNPLTNGTLALWRVMATAPSDEQMREIYETERRLFEANAQCCLAGTSNAVTTLAYDPDTDQVHVGTSYGRSTFKGLARVGYEATPVGAATAIAGAAGIIAQGGATGADIYVPAFNLREELERDAEQAAAFGQTLVAHDFDATASQTAFTLPVGWEPVMVYAASGAGSATLQREGSGKQWTRSFNGYKWTVTFASGRSASDWVSIMAKRTVK